MNGPSKIIVHFMIVHINIPCIMVLLGIILQQVHTRSEKMLEINLHIDESFT